MSEASLHILFYLHGFLVEGVLGVGPFCPFQNKLLLCLLALYGDVIVVDVHNFAHHAVIETVLRVVLDKHDLGSFLQHQVIVGRVRHLREIAFHLGLERMLPTVEQRQFVFVYLLCRTVMCGKSNVVGFLGRCEVGDVALVQFGKGGIRCLVGPYLVEQGNEPVVLLSVYSLQFDGEVSCLLQCPAREEVGGVVVLPQQVLFSAGGDGS